MVYKRISKGGSPDVYYTKDGHSPRSFCMTVDKDGQNKLQLLTEFPTAPLLFLNVGPFMLNSSRGGNITHGILNIDSLPGQTHSEISVAEIIDRDDSIKSAVVWWPFALLLVVLLVIALAYIVHNNSRASPTDSLTDADHADKYVSLKPEKEEADN